MKKIAFFDAKPYDKLWFEKLGENSGYKFKYFENKLNSDTAPLAKGCDGAIAFVNDIIDKDTIECLYESNINILALRSAGFNNVDFSAAFGKVHVTRVPAYSPYAVAEHAMALLLTLNRKIHRAYNRTRDYNFTLNGLSGFDLHGKTIGVIGTGKIGQVFIDICRGFGTTIIAHDPYPVADKNIDYVGMDELLQRSDVISLHCPLTESTHHILNEEAFGKMKDGVYIINTSRGALIESGALLHALKTKKVGGAGLDVYEEESELFFEDFSNTIIQDDVLSLLVSLPNVIVTSHQAFFTNEALEKIAQTTIENLNMYFNGETLTNEICYQCTKSGTCDKTHKNRCF